MKDKNDFYMSLGLIAICALFGQQVLFLPRPTGGHLFTAATFPIITLVLLAVLSLLLLCKSLRGERRQMNIWPERAIFGPIVAMGGLIFAYMAGFIYLGDLALEYEAPAGTSFVVTTFLFLTCAQYIARARKPMQVFLVSSSITGGLYLVFVLLFKVPLP